MPVLDHFGADEENGWKEEAAIQVRYKSIFRFKFTNVLFQGRSPER